MAEATAAETEAQTAYDALTQKNKVSRAAKTEEAKGKENEVRAGCNTAEDARFMSRSSADFSEGTLDRLRAGESRFKAAWGSLFYCAEARVALGSRKLVVRRVGGEALVVAPHGLHRGEVARDEPDELQGGPRVHLEGAQRRPGLP